MAKQNNTIFWIIGIAILLFIILPKLQVPAEEGMIGLTPHYYKDGVEIFPTFSLLRFSVVTPPGGTYDQISFDISATNQDVPIENIQVINAYPQAFKDALPTTTQTLAAQETKILWTSELMDTEQFEAVSPINFWIEVSGVETYTDTTIFPDRAYSGEISFEVEGPSPTQTFFSTLFSIVDFGGQTYHEEKGELLAGGQGVFYTILDYSGSGYFTGMHVESGSQGVQCVVNIDGNQYADLGSAYPHYNFPSFLDTNNIVRFENSLNIKCKMFG